MFTTAGPTRSATSANLIGRPPPGAWAAGGLSAVCALRSCVVTTAAVPPPTASARIAAVHVPAPPPGLVGTPDMERFPSSLRGSRGLHVTPAAPPLPDH